MGISSLSSQDDKRNIIVHYGNSQFIHELPSNTDDWNNDTFLQLIAVIKERCDLEENISLYEQVISGLFNEQLIIDDIDDVIAMFEAEESDNGDTGQYAKTPHIYVKDYNAMERENWTINSYLQIYSRSKKQWFRGQITRIVGKYHNEWFMVKYNEKFTKEIQRNSKDLKAIPSKSIFSLHTGSKCLIMSDYASIWHVGIILSVLLEDAEEWLAIKYTENEIDKIVEIQRNSADLKVFDDENYAKLIMAQQNAKPQQLLDDANDDEKAIPTPNTLEARIQALARHRNEKKDKEIMDLLRIFGNILKSPFDSKFQSILTDEVKHKWMSNPICVELLCVDAGFKKTSNGKRLKFSIQNMKALQRTNEALKDAFVDLAEALVVEEEEAKIYNAEEYTDDAMAKRWADLESLIYGSFDTCTPVNFPQGQGILIPDRNSNGNGTSNWQHASLFN